MPDCPSSCSSRRSRTVRRLYYAHTPGAPKPCAKLTIRALFPPRRLQRLEHLALKEDETAAESTRGGTRGTRCASDHGRATCAISGHVVYVVPKRELRRAHSARCRGAFGRDAEPQAQLAGSVHAADVRRAHPCIRVRRGQLAVAPRQPQLADQPLQGDIELSLRVARPRSRASRGPCRAARACVRRVG